MNGAIRHNRLHGFLHDITAILGMDIMFCVIFVGIFLPLTAQHESI